MTELQRHLEHDEMVERGWIDVDGRVLARFKTPEQGAATTVWAATSPQPDGLGGVYCEDVEVAEVNDDPAGRTGVRSWRSTRRGGAPVGVVGRSHRRRRVRSHDLTLSRQSRPRT